MAKVIILTHGGLAQCLYDTVGLFIAQRNGVVALGMDEDTHEFKMRLREAVVDSPEADILILVDLFGGTPFNMAASLLGSAKERGKRVEIVSGVNLPMLLDVTYNIPFNSLEELKRMAFDMGKVGIRDIMAELDAKKGGEQSGSSALSD